MCPFYKSMCHVCKIMTTHYTLERPGSRPIMPVLLSVQNILAHTTSAQIPYMTLTGHNDLYPTHSIICNDFQVTFSAYFTVPLQGTMDRWLNPYWPTNCLKSTCPFCKSPRHCANHEKHYNMECAPGKCYSDIPGQRCDRNRQNTMSSKSRTDQEWRCCLFISGVPIPG
jgi:hypothetical protein